MSLMRPFLLGIALVVTLAATSSLRSSQDPKTASSGTSSSKKGVIHLVIRSDSDLKRVFTYFPYPAIPAQYRFAKLSGTGIYRLAVDPQGTVTEIKILKRIGVFGDWPADVTALKTLIRWRAKPGPNRIVDATWSIHPGFQFITNEGSHIPRR
jgi:TonB family protein